MTPESTPTGPEPKKARTKKAKEPKPESTASDKQTTANRQNSLRSTGPKTPRGKAVSSRNALRHGHCALVVDVPGEDPELFRMRFDAWRAELNPAGSTHGDYLVSVAVRRSLDLDRLNVARTARTADRVRSARAGRTESRSREVEELLKRLQDDCGTAARQLRLTTEGCQALIDEWDHLKAPLLWPPHWDEKDASRVAHLQGRGRVSRREAPNVMLIPTQWIANHRKVARKLKDNEHGDASDHLRRYYSQSDHDRDRENLPDLEAACKHGVDWIGTVIEAEQKHLREHMEDLKEPESMDEAETMLRARLDPSDEGRLLRRYEAEAERGLFKVIDLLRGGMKAWAKSMQDNEQKALEAEVAVAASPAGAAAEPRNEANSGGVREVRTGVEVVEVDGVSVVQMTIVPSTDPPDQR